MRLPQRGLHGGQHRPVPVLHLPAPDAPQGRRGGQGRPVGQRVYYEIANPEVAAVLSALFGDREEEYQCTISR
ncbi:MAG: hypothetical protein ACLRWQ_08640 [Flavonifractor plautii]